MAGQCASRLLFRHEEVPCAQFVHKKHGPPETLEEYLASVPEPARSAFARRMKDFYDICFKANTWELHFQEPRLPGALSGPVAVVGIPPFAKIAKWKGDGWRRSFTAR
jgi:hypothetical protein